MKFFELEQSIFGSSLRREIIYEGWFIFVKLYYNEGFIDYTLQRGNREPFVTPNTDPNLFYAFYRLNGCGSWLIEWCFNQDILMHHRYEYKQTAQEVWDKSLRQYTTPTPII